VIWPPFGRDSIVFLQMYLFALTDDVITMEFFWCCKLRQGERHSQIMLKVHPRPACFASFLWILLFRVFPCPAPVNFSLKKHGSFLGVTLNPSSSGTGGPQCSTGLPTADLLFPTLFVFLPSPLPFFQQPSLKLLSAHTRLVLQARRFDSPFAATAGVHVPNFALELPPFR